MRINGFEDGRALVGSTPVDLVVEWQGPLGPMDELFPALRENRDIDTGWLGAPYVEESTNSYVATVQTHILRSDGMTILIDTGCGNHKERPGFPLFGGWDTPYLDDLAGRGVRPEEVDLVVTTHCHLDHTGWNTRLENGEWVPTFPNARYLLCEDEFDFWNPENPFTRHGAETNQNVFEDSVAPIARSGQLSLWKGEKDISSQLRLVQAPGHTPGSAVLLVESDGEKGLFVGDILHTPLQLTHPHVHWCSDEDVPAATATRAKILHWAADENMHLFPAHFTGGTRLTRDGSAFRMD